ncbi:SE1832 family protein [Aquibacillus salsiterrae]|uniref:SE1832 family protein n=1 Tax=Aquibacillus salsiterrae TaxID=2950439 RepID=A0A9X3WD37_9BACI|nr:SE1832 family protein [Aquibacillus salsiterrae]MDC3417647.1 SE1832 family protein [Aquibacillus salsiterrae]
MDRKEIENKINEVKSDYIRFQSDLEKLNSVGGNTTNAEKQLATLEEELSNLNKQLANLK